MSDPIRWGILGTGNIANKFANAMQRSEFGTVVAVASRSKEGAQEFKAKWDVANAYSSYDWILVDPNIEAVYIALPNHMHAEWALKAAQHGKHVLCEKPLTANAQEAQALLVALEKYPVLFAESFLYRFHPQTQKIYDLIKEKTIGDIRFIEADFCFNLGHKTDNIRMNKGFAGGGIMDVGCYAVSMARLLAGASANKPYLEPVLLQATGKLDPESGVDLWASALLEFENGVIANLNCSTQCKSDNRLVILGSKGRIEVGNPWKPTQQEVIKVFDQDEQVSLVEVTAHTDVMGLEFEQLHARIRGGEKDVVFPAMTRQESLANMAVLDRWRQAIGLFFEQDKLSTV